MEFARGCSGALLVPGRANELIMIGGTNKFGSDNIAQKVNLATYEDDMGPRMEMVRQKVTGFIHNFKIFAFGDDDDYFGETYQLGDEDWVKMPHSYQEVLGEPMDQNWCAAVVPVHIQFDPPPPKVDKLIVDSDSDVSTDEQNASDNDIGEFNLDDLFNPPVELEKPEEPKPEEEKKGKQM